MVNIAPLILIAFLCQSCTQQKIVYRSVSNIPLNSGLHTWIPSYMPMDSKNIVFIINNDLNTIEMEYESEEKILDFSRLTPIDLNKQNIQQVRKIRGDLSNDYKFYCFIDTEYIVAINDKSNKVFSYSDLFVQKDFCKSLNHALYTNISY